jgi:hypothetical protein
VPDLFPTFPWWPGVLATPSNVFHSDPEAQSGSRGGKLTQGYMHMCRTLLAYYHHPYGGSKPFSLDFEALSANDPIIRDMSAHQLEYMRWMKGEMARQSE